MTISQNYQNILKAPWTSYAVIYQIYPLSFHYQSGSQSDPHKGKYGNIKGIIEKISYIESLGVDAVWLCPFFDSPLQTGFGYNITNYRAIGPTFGTMDDFDEMVNTFHQRNIKVLIDQVYSHTDITHPWFQASRDPTHPEHEKYKDYYVWYPSDKIDFCGGEAVPPNNWRCIMAMVESAWEWDRGRQSFYLHSFDQRMPDLNLNNPTVRAEILDIAKFWLDRGVDGFRLDALCHYGYDPEFRNNPLTIPEESFHPTKNPQRKIYDVNQPTGRILLEDLQNLAYSYAPYTKQSLPNKWAGRLKQLKKLLSTEKQAPHQTPVRVLPSFVGEYNFDKGPDAALQGVSLVGNPEGPCGCFYTAALRDGPNEGRGLRSFRADVEEMLRISHGASRINWAMSNHDMARILTRWFGDDHTPQHAKLCLSLLLSLPGSICIFQGEELGLDNPILSSVKREDEDFRKHDPLHLSIDALYPWDAARTPMPWTGSGNEHMMWLKLPASHLGKTVLQQQMDPRSVLSFAREAIAFRRKNSSLHDPGDVIFHDTQCVEHVVFVRRSHITEESMLCAFNFSDKNMDLTYRKDSGTLVDLGNNLCQYEVNQKSIPPLTSFFSQITHVD